MASGDTRGPKKLQLRESLSTPYCGPVSSPRVVCVARFASTASLSCSLSSYVELKSSDLDLSKDNVAVGAKSDLALMVSFFDCSYSSWAIIRSGLLFFDIAIASFN